MISKKIVAAAKIKKGDIFSVKNLTSKRSIKGISAKFWYDFIGKVSTKNFDIDDPIF